MREQSIRNNIRFQGLKKSTSSEAGQQTSLGTTILGEENEQLSLKLESKGGIDRTSRELTILSWSRKFSRVNFL